MEKEFIGKNVEVIVSFANSLIDTGSVPDKYCGRLESSDENFIKLVYKKETKIFNKNIESGSTLINKRYIILISEL